MRLKRTMKDEGNVGKVESSEEGAGVLENGSKNNGVRPARGRAACRDLKHACGYGQRYSVDPAVLRESKGYSECHIVFRHFEDVLKDMAPVHFEALEGYIGR